MRSRVPLLLEGIEEFRDTISITYVREDFPDEGTIFYRDCVGMQGYDLSEDIRTRQEPREHIPGMDGLLRQ